MKMRTILILAALAFVVTLAVVVGQRLSDEALAVLLGVIVGVAASIPTSLIMAWLATRAAGSRTRTIHVSRPEADSKERVVVVQQQPQQADQWALQPTRRAAPLPPRGSSGWPDGYDAPQGYPPRKRRFTIIGGIGDSEWEE